MLAVLALLAVPLKTSSVVVLHKPTAPPQPSASASAEASPPTTPSPSPPPSFPDFTARDDSGTTASLLARTFYAQSGFLLPAPCREDLPHIFGAMGLLGNAAEVGVLRGEFSKTILEAWPGAKLYLVDPWAHQEAYVDINNGPDQNYHEQNLAETLRNVQPWRARVQILRGMSVDAAGLLPDGHLDWAYLDADHSYSAVRADLRAWWPKIKEGGVLSGHDMVFDGVYPKAGEFGVMRAVLEHAAEVGRQVVTTFAEPGGPTGPNSTHCRTRVPSWYMRK